MTSMMGQDNANAADPRTKQILEIIFGGERIDPDLLSDGLRAVLPVEQLQQIRDELSQKFGRFLGVIPRGARGEGVALDYEKAVVPVNATVNEAGQLAGLYLQDAIPKARRPDQALTELSALPGEVVYVVYINGKVKYERARNKSLGVGSAFKLLVFGEYLAQINAGKIREEEVVRLQTKWVSPGSGELEKWPTGLPVTLSTLAALMFSQSDNTATTALMEVLGRERLHSTAPLSARPLLTPR
ncbi:MAG: serine hydrolase, partial [Pirellulaceae bacterium]